MAKSISGQNFFVPTGGLSAAAAQRPRARSRPWSPRPGSWSASRPSRRRHGSRRRSTSPASAAVGTMSASAATASAIAALLTASSPVRVIRAGRGSAQRTQKRGGMQIPFGCLECFTRPAAPQNEREGRTQAALSFLFSLRASAYPPGRASRGTPHRRSTAGPDHERRRPSSQLSKKTSDCSQAGLRPGCDGNVASAGRSARRAAVARVGHQRVRHVAVVTDDRLVVAGEDARRGTSSRSSTARRRRRSCRTARRTRTLRPATGRTG